MRSLILLFWAAALVSKTPDYDVVIVGTSPFSLLEALYSYHSGKSVLILEQSNECGGAWKSLTVCGVPHADLGCHKIGTDVKLLNFFETYLGCNMVSLENPLLPYKETDQQGYYFSEGCYECIDHLLKLIEQTEIVLLMNHRLESIEIDPFEPLATIKTKDLQWTASKLILPRYSDIRIENHPTTPLANQGTPPYKYPHLYILLEDVLPPQFSYCEHSGAGIARMMNLTHFTHLTESGKQLIVFQFHGEINAETPQMIVDHLTSKQYVSSAARILAWDTYIYEQNYVDKQLISQTPNSAVIIEMMNSSHIAYLSQSIPKWEAVLKPYREATAIPISLPAPAK